MFQAHFVNKKKVYLLNVIALLHALNSENRASLADVLQKGNCFELLDAESTHLVVKFSTFIFTRSQALLLQVMRIQQFIALGRKQDWRMIMNIKYVQKAVNMPPILSPEAN